MPAVLVGTQFEADFNNTVQTFAALMDKAHQAAAEAVQALAAQAETAAGTDAASPNAAAQAARGDEPQRGEEAVGEEDAEMAADELDAQLADSAMLAEVLGAAGDGSLALTRELLALRAAARARPNGAKPPPCKVHKK